MSHRLVLLLAVLIASLQLLAQNQLHITNTSLPQGQQGNIYSEVFSAAGGISPYSWKISAGGTPPGLAMSRSGVLVGTPNAAGTFDFTVDLADGGTSTVTRNFSIRIASATGFDGPARLPIATVDTSMMDTPASGSIITVDAGGDLQAALDSAQCGDAIKLQAGATFTGKFRFPALRCDS
jgi:hypothetical protein